MNDKPVKDYDYVCDILNKVGRFVDGLEEFNSTFFKDLYEKVDTFTPKYVNQVVNYVNELILKNLDPELEGLASKELKEATEALNEGLEELVLLAKEGKKVAKSKVAELEGCLRDFRKRLEENRRKCSDE
jgi:hypothetical protein